MAVVVWVVFPGIAATRKAYFDINNGRLKSDYVSFGRIYKIDIIETEYSKLLKKFGYDEMPADWKPAASVELGFRKCLNLQRRHGPYLKVRSAADTFAFWLDIQDKMTEKEKREHLEKFRILLREGTPEQICEYAKGLKLP